MSNRIEGATTFTGEVNCTNRLRVPAVNFSNADISPSAGIAATKLEHQFPVSVQLFPPATSVAALTLPIYTVIGTAGEIVGMEAWISVVADDVSRTISVDLQKSTGGGSFATVCSATADFTSSSTVRVPVPVTLSGSSLIAGDLLQLVVTVAGGTGNQATGLHATVMLRETAA
jgi:hypothetical protein